jgi:two-component system, OmpR family, alkaline phosphatase synthesis response regulator PhoP
MCADSARRILVVEDEAHIAEGLRINLTLQGYVVEVAANGSEALAAWKVRRPDLVVLDIMLPGIDGLSVLEHIRLEDRQIPILILSARGGSDDRVKGLAGGADDYLPKPFNLDEFLLRVQRLLDRARWHRQPPPDTAPEPETFAFGDNCIDFTTGSALCRQGRIRLTEQELRLLKLFVRYRNKPLSREKILEIGWGYSGQMTTRTVDNFIVRFRKYFEEDPRHPRYFKSLRAVGYRFEPD